MSKNPQNGQRWRHPSLGEGIVGITPGGYIHVLFDSGMTAAYRAVKDFHEDRFVRVIDREN